MRDTVAPVSHLVPTITQDELRDLAGHRELAVAIGRGHHDKAEAVARRILHRGLEAATAVLASGPRPPRTPKGSS